MNHETEKTEYIEIWGIIIKHINCSRNRLKNEEKIFFNNNIKTKNVIYTIRINYENIVYRVFNLLKNIYPKYK